MAVVDGLEADLFCLPWLWVLSCVKPVVWAPEANLFCTVLSCGEVDLCELRGTSFAFPYCGCSPLGEVGVVDL